ncbi:MAG: hypothetical protein ACKVVP_23575 [Chloroflexota bacterium]
MVTWRWGILALVSTGLLLSLTLGVSAQAEPSARVAGTGGEGVVLRSEASRAASMLTVVPEGAVVTLIGPEQVTEGRAWRPVRDSVGRVGWLAAEYLIIEELAVLIPTPAHTVETITFPPAVALTGTPLPRIAAPGAAEPDPTPGLPVSLEIRFKLPEVSRNDRQEIVVYVSRNSEPVQGAIVRFIVDDEDPEVEREASVSDLNGRSMHDWSMRKYRGTTTVRVTAEAPDGGTGKASRSFFVK